MSRRRQKPRDPDAHLGVYKRLEDVKNRHRLGRFQSTYAGRDVYGHWVENVRRPESKTQQGRYRRFGATWRDFVEFKGRHHALPTPQHVNGYAEWLLDGRAITTILSEYWTHLANFFEYLLWHDDHEHRYNVVAMAARNYDAARTIWDAHREYVANGGTLPEDYDL
jgi:hypothetical protein